MFSNDDRDIDSDNTKTISYVIMPIILSLMMNGYIRLTSGLINDVVELTERNRKIH